MTSSFEQLFGIPKDNIHPVCILTPFLTKPLIDELGLERRFRGKPYAGFSHHDFTLIETRMGPLFTGDAILNLNDSPCQTIIFIGACGSLNDQLLPIGSLVTPSNSFALESFSAMAAGSLSFEQNVFGRPDPAVLFSERSNVFSTVQCASVGSIALEAEFAPLFIEKKISVLDMECASVFSAANKIKRPASALLYVTDIIGSTSPYDITTGHADIQKIENAQTQAAQIILAATQNYADRRSRF
jgi:nucleoside phosphorylase